MDAGVIYLTIGRRNMVIHGRVEGAQVMHLAMHGPPLWVYPHQVMRSKVPESGPQWIPQAFLPVIIILIPFMQGTTYVMSVRVQQILVFLPVTMSMLSVWLVEEHGHSWQG